MGLGVAFESAKGERVVGYMGMYDRQKVKERVCAGMRETDWSRGRRKVGGKCKRFCCQK